ncbi:MAG: hypothetical protein ACI9S8_002519, partial [Chlamydiales bacterium]
TAQKTHNVFDEISSQMTQDKEPDDFIYGFGHS